MSIIDLAIPLDAQPRYLDVLRADVPFKFVYVPPLGRVSLASPATWFGANGSGLLGRAGPSGSAVYSSGATNAERWTGIETGSDFTIIALVLDSSGRGSNRSPIDADNNSTVGRNWQFRLGTGNQLQFFVFNTSLSSFGTGPTAVTSATDPSVLVGRVSNGVVNSWLNGIGGTPTTITGTQQTLTASELLGVGGRVDSGGAVSQFFGGNIYGVFVIAGALPEGLIQSFVSPDKVWAWAFEPREIQVFVPAGAGATDLVLADATHGHTADNVVLTTDTALTIQDATHGHTADNITLTTSTTLAVQSAVHGHTADSLTLTTASTLAVEDATHAHSADSLVLSTDSTLAVQDATHAHSADNLTLAVTGQTTLVVADATHAHTADSLALTTDSTLAVQDALHGHTAESLTLSTGAVADLVVQDATHGHTAESLTLVAGSVLTVEDAIHAQQADNLALVVESWLVVADALHVQRADNITLIDGETPIYAAIPASRKARGRFGERPAQLSTGRRR